MSEQNHIGREFFVSINVVIPFTVHVRGEEGITVKEQALEVLQEILNDGIIDPWVQTKTTDVHYEDPFIDKTNVTVDDLTTFLEKYCCGDDQVVPENWYPLDEEDRIYEAYLDQDYNFYDEFGPNAMDYTKLK